MGNPGVPVGNSDVPAAFADKIGQRSLSRITIAKCWLSTAHKYGESSHSGARVTARLCALGNARGGFGFVGWCPWGSGLIVGWLTEGSAAMSISTAVEVVIAEEPVERREMLAVAGFLAGYGGSTRVSYANRPSTLRRLMP